MVIYNSTLFHFVSFMHQTMNRKNNAGSYLKKLWCECVRPCRFVFYVLKQLFILYFCSSTKHMFRSSRGPIGGERMTGKAFASHTRKSSSRMSRCADDDVWGRETDDEWKSATRFPVSCSLMSSRELFFRLPSSSRAVYRRQSLFLIFRYVFKLAIPNSTKRKL